jgi:[acyl-carrier-protein] S-malonyltransferase
VLVLVAPGQGAQAPGFLTPWLDLPGFEDRLNWLSACAGIDLVHYGTKADAETIRDTSIAQPLLVASAMLSALALFPHPADAFRVVGAAAGHSVGEIAAAAGAGVISAEQAMVFVRERGKAMAGAAATMPTSMIAVLGDEETVLKKIAEHELTPANMNGAGQIVAAGTIEQLAAFQNDPPNGARLRQLSVAGAFHTHHMAPAVATLERFARAVSTHDARLRLISNADGGVVHDGREVLRRLVAQVSTPVRWDLCMRTMDELGTTGVIEVPPAGTLTGLVKRALPGVDTLAMKTPDDLDAAHAFVERHGVASPLGSAPTWRLVVAPGSGTVRIAAGVTVGRVLEPGAVIGSLAARRDETPLVAVHGGTIVEWLVEDGDPVSPGQPLVRLHPEGVHA